MPHAIALDLLERRIKALEEALEPLDAMAYTCRETGNVLGDAVIGGCSAYLTMAREITNERIRVYRAYLQQAGRTG